MDPQRQYARLPDISLWAAAAKAARRQGHRLGREPRLDWIRLAQGWAVRDLDPRFLPTEPLSVVLDSGGGRIMLTPAPVGGTAGDWRWPVIGLRWQAGPALSGVAGADGPQIECHVELARCMGRRGWRTLGRLSRLAVVPSEWRVARVAQAVDVVAMLARMPDDMVPDARDWPTLARLYRHRGQALPGPALQRPYAFLERREGRWAWPEHIGDEDSVHGARRSPGGGTSGGCGADVRGGPAALVSHAAGNQEPLRADQ